MEDKQEKDKQIAENKEPKPDQVRDIDEEFKQGGVFIDEKDPNIIKRVGQIKNEDGEWVEYTEEDKADRPPIAYTYMGDPGMDIDDDSEQVDFCMQYRIPQIEGLENCPNLKRLFLRKNLITKIDNIEHCTQLEELELYDNRISVLENLTPFKNMIVLDLAFNVIKEITPGSLDSLVNLKKIYLSANKLRKMQGLENLKSLEVLDLGDNRLRKIEGIENLTGIKELHLAKNKLQVIENISHLKNLFMLTLQANFISVIEGLDELPNIEQLYFQQNRIKKISGLENLKKLEIFDVAVNDITNLEGLESQSETLEELWINNNKIQDWKDLEYLGKTLKKMNNLYVACNPIHSRGKEFKTKLQEAVPCLKELEGVPFNRPVYMFSTPANSIMKKGINPKAKSILNDILGKEASDQYHKDIELQEKEDAEEALKAQENQKKE